MNRRYVKIERQGCDDINQRCVSCVLPICRWDMPPKAAKRYVSALAMQPLLTAGLTYKDISVRTGVSLRTVKRQAILLQAITHVPRRKQPVTLDEYQQMLKLRADGLTYGQIAVQLRRSVGTVEGRLVRKRGKLPMA